MLEKNNNGYYAAFKAKDPRFDGRFFIGISTTGIYCRPICRARLPKEENCNYYFSPAEAEQAGFRPCLLCRPELAPGKSIIDAKKMLVHKAAKMMEENCGSGDSIEEIAKELGCSNRHLRRVFMEEYNVTPIQYLQTCRLLLSKNLLTDTNLSVIDVAMASGFGSLRRFNDLFKKHYNLSPTSFRKGMSLEKRLDDNINILLSYRPPYQWYKMLSFLRSKAIPGVELVTKSEYYRTIQLEDANKRTVSGWLKIGHLKDKNALKITVSESLLPVLPKILGKVRKVFDLDSEPDIVFTGLQTMYELRPDLPVNGTRLPGCFDPLEVVVKEVLNGDTESLREFVKAKGYVIETGIEGLNYIFPKAKDVLEFNDALDIGGEELEIIKRLAKLIEENEINFNFSLNPETEFKKLSEIPGLNVKAAKYIAMFTMDWTDAFVYEDLDVMEFFKRIGDDRIASIIESWRPWRSYAMMNILNQIHENK